ncbi:UDP-N-acetyl-D-mannosamine dehydrogenase [Glaciecola petra]|uniref:UDP-N-acetyl-D-mannosamine dehydrogenase n=1 Tax=Glaciecola petra TaxID=3075602 RepID=A0ABU2ZPX6_9ALTE|nr:UDP-N-acetyl-D-mannosamine dehydrogenase [Aestuariibacter sp. P117]MDT0593659.1 UDP-N-acetyl-D-mannosamine dehydrogenase [Aestuariibacter sp. P117]
MSFETVSVIGLGYIGLPTAAMFAAHGKNVIGVDVNANAVNTINRGEIHIVEPDLDAMVAQAVQKGMLRASLEASPADAFLIAVPTPFKSDGGDIPTPDLSYIESACKSIAPVLKKGDLVVLESTSPVGATEQVVKWLQDFRPDLKLPNESSINTDVYVAHCPERVLPGHVVRELIENDRVIGGITKACSERAVALYQTFVQGECVVTNARTAEMAKLTENASRDVSIAFANELSLICDETNIDVWELIALANRHPRVNILQPGPGVGGHCIAVDPWFIVSKSPETAKIIKTARHINDGKPGWVVDKVKIAVADFLTSNPNKTIKDVKIACYGLAFKPDIDDLRESPALGIAKLLTSEYQTNCISVEPNIGESQSPAEINLVDFEFARQNADIHILLVDHKLFKNSSLPDGIVIDTKGIWKTK